MALDPTQCRVYGCDLFLLEKWEASSTEPDDKQMMQIFERFIKLPLNKRLVYTQQVKDRGLVIAGNLSQQEQDLLARARPIDERGTFKNQIMLQTYYGPGSSEVMATYLQDPSLEVTMTVISNASRYDFGRDWQRVFHRIPQLLDVDSEYEVDVAEALQEDVEFEREMRENNADEGYEEDGYEIAACYSSYHTRKSIGFICIMDETALGDHGGDLLQRQIPVGWFDADGRLVRWTKETAQMVFLQLGSIACGTIDGSELWTKADMDYDAFPHLETENSSEGESESEGEE